MKTKKTILFTLIIFNSYIVFGEPFVKPKISYTQGSNSYHKTTMSVEIGTNFYVQPSLSLQSSDFSNGTRKTFSSRLGFRESRWGLGLDMGLSPEHDGYQRQFLGGDGWKNFEIFPDRLVIDLGTGIMITRHADNLQVVNAGTLGAAQLKSLDRGPGRGGRDDDDDDIITPRGNEVAFLQTDVFGSFGVFLFRTVGLSVDYTKSSYNKNLQTASVRSVELQGDNDGVTSLLIGYPDYSVDTRFDVYAFKRFSPYVSHHITHYETGEATSRSWRFGVAFSIKQLNLDASIEQLRPAPSSSVENYTTLSGYIRI